MSTEKKTFPDDWNPDNVVEIKDDAADPFLPEVITPKEAESLAGGLSKKNC